MSKFDYINKMMDGESTRSRSKKQESNLAKLLNGKVTINSGATFGQNDVIADFCEVEAKTTTKESFSITLAAWRKLRKKCAGSKIPIFVLDFEKSKDTLAILTMDDLKFLIEQANEKTT